MRRKLRDVDSLDATARAYWPALGQRCRRPLPSAHVLNQCNQCIRKKIEQTAMIKSVSGLRGEGAQESSKTFVLVHGAWHGGWCWTRVAERLRGAGHRVFTPTLTGLGDRAHLLSPQVGLDTFVQDVVVTLEMEDLTDSILVGHSFAGAPITGAADRVPERITHLVYLDAALPQNGESVFSRFPPQIVAERRKLAQETSGGLTLPVPPPSSFGVEAQE